MQRGPTYPQCPFYNILRVFRRQESEICGLDRSKDTVVP
jgi:hypothetical protein